MFPHLGIKEKVFIWEKVGFRSKQKIRSSQLNIGKNIAGTRNSVLPPPKNSEGPSCVVSACLWVVLLAEACYGPDACVLPPDSYLDFVIPVIEGAAFGR